MNNYLTALYRRNNYGQPCFWEIFATDNVKYPIRIQHGVLGGKLIIEDITTHRSINDEITTRIKNKRKTGYKNLNELKDNVSLPVEGDLMNYLLLYLPHNRTSNDGTLLPMLAKTYDNKDNKLFKSVDYYLVQPKINGLRCFISAHYNQGDMFKPISLKFQSREGTYWNSLSDLEDYLLHTIEEKVLIEMVENHIILDGELYLPGYSVNEINHFVKDPNCKENKLLQYWCYDIAIEDTIQIERDSLRFQYFYMFENLFDCKEKHLTNKNRFITLKSVSIDTDFYATNWRNKYIDFGFEGLILRNPQVEYQFGKRNSSMIKYKKSTDGKFTIVDIYPEGIKRNNIPLFLCKNDINDSTFECHVGGSLEYQEKILKNKDCYIGRTMYVEYGERSGVNQVPFHIKSTYIINDYGVCSV